MFLLYCSVLVAVHTLAIQLGAAAVLEVVAPVYV
jgi:hypothetical protein